jgi:RNA recognition motif-containing protein
MPREPNRRQQDRRNPSQQATHRTPAPPCRTLFVRNVKFDTLEEDVKKKFEPFGDIKVIFNLIPKRGLIFITFVSIKTLELYNFDRIDFNVLV